MKDKPQKLNVLLAKTDHLAAPFKALFVDYIKFFKGSYEAFRGERKTYIPKAGVIDQPGQRGNKLVVTTWEEKGAYLEENSKEYIDALFSQEKTNASGRASADLIVEEINFGKYSSLELMKLKGILESQQFREMYENIPARTDNEIWEKTTNAEYTKRAIWQTPLQTGVLKTTVKDPYILEDPNLDKIDGAKYTPQVASRDSVVELGDTTYQKYSGEILHIDRAAILKRRTALLSAVIEAMKIANEAEVVKSDMTSEKLFGYLHRGKI